MQEDKKGLIMPTIVLAAICLIISFLLAGTNMVTKDRIEQNEIAEANAARMEVLPGASGFEDAQFSYDNKNYLELYTETSGLGTVVTTTAKGYGGLMKIITGFDSEGSVTAIRVLTSSETPGLGKKTEDVSFWGQYQGSPGPFTVVKGAAGTDGEVKAVTGATISSRAVTEAVNLAREVLTAYQGR